MRVAKIENHHSEEELENLLKEYKTDAEVQNRILCILAVKKGITINDVAKVLNKSRMSCSKWIRQYNENSIDGILSKRSNSGVEGYLSEIDLIRLKAELTKNNRKFTIKETISLMETLFGRKFDYKYVWDVTRKKLKLNYGKPTLKYKEHPEYYKQQLKDSLESFLLEDVKLFFLDQSHFKNMPYLVRLLYDPEDKDNILVRTGKRFGISITGFLSANGISFADAFLRNNAFTTIYSLIKLRILNMENEKGKEILMKILGDETLNRSYIKNQFKKENKTPKERVEEIREVFENEEIKPKISDIQKISYNKKITSSRISNKQRETIKALLFKYEVDSFLNNEIPLLIICDNAKIHTATDVLIACELLNIKLVFLPPYSPDLNPIEDLWRIIKQKVYSSNYNSLAELIKLILDEFYKNVDNESLFRDWLDEYI